MGEREALGLVSGSMYFLATLPYISAALRGRVQPHFLAWAGGGVISGTTFVVQVTTDPTWSAAVAGASFIYCWIVAVIAFRRGSRVSTPFDKACLVLGLLNIAAWRVTQNPRLATVLAITADAILCLPMLRKTYLNPKSEIPGPFLLSALAAGLAAIAALHPTLVDIGWPTYLTLLNLAVALLALRAGEGDVRVLTP